MSARGVQTRLRISARGVQTRLRISARRGQARPPQRRYAEGGYFDEEQGKAPAYGAPTKYHSVARTLCGVIFGVPAKYRNEVRTLCGGKERARKGKVKAALVSGFCKVRRASRRGSVHIRT